MRWVLPAASAGCVAALAGGIFVWSAPREQVPVPGPDATPEQVVSAYIDAVNARDFDTANAIDARPGEYGRFSRPLGTHALEVEKAVVHRSRAHVLFMADFDGGEPSMQDGWWGYSLVRGDDGLWHITGEGVA